MLKVAKFEKVSLAQFKRDLPDLIRDSLTDNAIEELYENIKLPQRATKGSAGYDFKLPYDILLSPGETILIPTGIRVKIVDGWVLKLYPRSGLGFKYRLQLNNTVGIIDSDYYYSANEGHIMAKITNDTNEDKTLTLESGKGFMQGIFVEYGITVDDENYEKSLRDGGFGSTERS